jgi:hypothetical protein
MNKFYILIDNLDDRWVDVSVRFRLIRALIESLKAFRRITNLKIIVALRTDILERVVQETRDLTFQREKFEQYFVPLKWNNTDLKKLVNSRLRQLFRRQYTAHDISFEDVFTRDVGRQNPFDYIVERTLMRPRDVIAFVNECIKVSEGHYEVTATSIRRAELEFSRIRRDALEQEWQSAFPTIKKIMNFLGSKARVSIEFAELCSKDQLDELALSICAHAQIDFDPLFGAATAYVEGDGRGQLEFIKVIAGILRSG